MEILINHPLKNHSTFGIDVKSKLFVGINSAEDVTELLRNEKFANEHKLILGGGSNLLFTKDFEGLVCKISISGISLVEEDDQNVLIEAGAGVLWDDLVNYAIENNYGGIENLTLIPGTVGAAPIQNIGAYGQELAEINLPVRTRDLLEPEEVIGQGIQHEEKSRGPRAHKLHIILAHEPVGKLGGHGGDHPGRPFADQDTTAGEARNRNVTDQNRRIQSAHAKTEDQDKSRHVRP